MPTTKLTISILVTSGWAMFAQPFTPIRLTVPPGSPTAIPIKTLPDAVCALQQEGSDSSKSLKLYADQAGMVRFFAHPAGQTDRHTQLELRCQAGADSAVISVELRADNTPDPSMPAPVDLDPRARSGASFVRPALESDPMQYTAEALRRGGYPPRPDPNADPKAYAAWLRIVSQPVTFIAPQAVPTDRYHGPSKLREGAIENGPAISYNWSGFVATGKPGSFSQIEGRWIIPPAFGEPGGLETFSSMWVGIDGYGSGDVVQAGSEQDAIYISGFGNLSFTYAWTEYYPAPSYATPNFQVNPGDELSVVVGAFNGFEGNYLLIDSTAQTETVIDTWSGQHYAGNSAEWIMERPTVNGALPDLTDYVNATMQDAHAFKNGAWGTMGSLANVQVTMVRDPCLFICLDISTVQYEDPTDMLFVWRGFH